MLLALVLLSLFFTMLLFPETVFRGACDGLLLWYQILIPTPFSLSYCHRTFVENRRCCYCLPSAFPSFPSALWNFFLWKFRCSVRVFMRLSNGAKIIADLLLQGKISLEEASYLLSFCNNASPSFVITFLVLNTIHQKAFCIPALLLLFGTMILLSFLQRILRHFIKNKDWIFPGNVRSFHTGEFHFFKTTDAQNEFFCLRILYPEQFRNACKSRRLPDDLFCTSCIIGTSADSFTCFSSPEIFS